MDRYQAVLAQLARIETVLRAHQQWQEMPPQADLLSSDLPFCVDTLQPAEWLQWVLLPRMRAQIAGQLPLPEKCAVSGYYEVALAATCPLRQPLLAVLYEFDALFR